MALTGPILTLFQAATILPITSAIYRVVLYRESLILELWGTALPASDARWTYEKGALMSVSVVIPALNEAGNIGRLVAETYAAIPRDRLSEVIVVDDCSDDKTGEEIKSLLSTYPGLRYLRHGIRSGQSAAIRTGVLAASAPIIATMDGDGQNDPHDIPNLLSRLGATLADGPAMVGGVRAKRKAVGSRKLASVIANAIRNAAFQDQCPDSGCGIKVFWREAFLRLPFFTSMHRFMPALFLMNSYRVFYEPVNDRARLVGQSKYTNFGRAITGLYDLFGVVWLRKRTKTPPIVEDTAQIRRVSEAAPAPRAEVRTRHAAGE
jgi:glycosyltransferase involved in cell wall biosynthesis